ncbi:MAG: hypothetical protein JRE64_17730 [Deltaproteobacteria bacterium]|nr:hypothetical protein [Deltaproteobacteria bacterium]
MASDSSETHIDSAGRSQFVEVEKTLYFKTINVGISTWGDAEVGNQGINEWLFQTISYFSAQNKSPKVLEQVTNFLAKRLDVAFGLDGKIVNSSLHMGLHVAGYNSPAENAAPGICHVFIEPGFKRFDPQSTMLSLPSGTPGYHLRNGMYKEFAVMWPALSGIDASFRTLIASRYRSKLTSPNDPIALQAEWLGSWVKQMCLVIKTAGLPEYIGKTVKILAFNFEGNDRWFHLPEMKEKNHNHNGVAQPVPAQGPLVPRGL